MRHTYLPEDRFLPGERVPVVVPAPYEAMDARIASCVLARLAAHATAYRTEAAPRSTRPAEPAATVAA